MRPRETTTKTAATTHWHNSLLWRDGTGDLRITRILGDFPILKRSLWPANRAASATRSRLLRRSGSPRRLHHRHHARHGAHLFHEEAHPGLPQAAAVSLIPFPLLAGAINLAVRRLLRSETAPLRCGGRPISLPPGATSTYLIAGRDAGAPERQPTPRD